MVCDESEAGALIASPSTIAAIATPSGRGGVGIIRLSGPQALTIAAALSRESLQLKPRQATLASWFDDDGGALDSGLLLFFPKPHSYTGEDVVELHAHGSPVVLQALLQRLFDLGARPAEPGEFTRRAVLNGKMDLSQAEAVAACIDAATVRAAKQAQQQLHGEFARHIHTLMDTLTGLVAHVEACLDFPEEDVPRILYVQLRDRVEKELLAPMDRLIEGARLGQHLIAGARAAIIGAPNVGKSSLLNRLAGSDRAIVSELAGTTRDTVEVDFEVHGIPILLVDTAGLREASDPVEQEGVRRAKAAAGGADVVIFVAAADDPQTWKCSHAADIRVLNKVDLLGEQAVPESFVPTSAKSGEGIEALTEMLARMLGDRENDEGPLVTRERHRLALVDARRHAHAGLGLLGKEEELDLVALEWRRAWSSLGKILGIGDVEQILDRVFAEFCIGK